MGRPFRSGVVIALVLCGATVVARGVTAEPTPLMVGTTARDAVRATDATSGAVLDAGAQVRPVDQVDLDRYLGTWYKISRFPNRFQRQCAGDVTARYERRPDGRLSVINTCRTADGSADQATGVARVVDAATTAKLKVRFAPAVLSFLPAVWGDYWVLGLAADYSWATVGSPDRQYLWILGRQPRMDSADLALAVAAAGDNGFDTTRLVATRHTQATERRP